MTTTSSQKKLIIIISLFFFILNNISTLIGFAITPSGKIFTGASWMNPQDLHQYYSIMEQARRGESRIIYPFTVEEPQKRLSFRPLYQLLGYSEKLFNISHAVIFRTFNAILGIILIYCCWWFLNIFLSGEERIIGFIILLFSSGPIVNCVESFTFTSSAESPHIAYSLISIILIIGVSYKFFFLEFSNITMIINGLLLLLLGFIHPFDVVPICVVTTFFALVAICYGKISFTRASVGLSLMSIIGLPSSVYVLWTTIHDPILREFRQITIVESPNFLLLIVDYGLLLIPMTFGITKSFNVDRIKKICLSSWILIIIILMYLPSKIQGRFILGLHVPISILSSAGLSYLINRFGYKPLKDKGLRIFLAFLILLFAGNLRLIASNIKGYKSGEFPFYISKDFIAATKWLQENSSPTDGVLSGRWISNLIPAYSGNVVPWGNRFYEVFGNSELVWQKLLANELNTNNERSFLLKKGIKFILIDDLSRKQELKKFCLESRSYLQKVFERGEIIILQIKNE